MESRRHADDNIASPLLFSPKEFFLSLQTIFFSISSICFPLLYLYKKAQTTTFLIKFLRCFFSLSPIFLTFLGFGDYFTFWLFFFRVWEGKQVESGEDPIGSFLPCDMEPESCWCIKPFFPGSCDTTLLIPLVDFYGCLLWLSQAKAVAGYLLVGSGRYFEFCLLIQLHFIFQLRVVRRL